VGGMLIQEHQAAVGLEDHVQFANHSNQLQRHIEQSCGVLVTLLVGAATTGGEEGVSGGAAAALRVGDKGTDANGIAGLLLRESFWANRPRSSAAPCSIREALPRFEAVEEVRFFEGPGADRATSVSLFAGVV